MTTHIIETPEKSNIMQLQEKIAIITGASRGIGRSIALAFVRAGAKVVLASRKQDGLDAVMHEIHEMGGTALAIATHTGDINQCQQLVEKTVAALGRVDILVNNAATNPHFGPVITSESGQWQKIFEVNIMGYFTLAKFAAAVMQKNGGGKIINMASVAGITPGPMMGVYSISKAAVIMLTKVLAQELGSYNIQVNAIAPGIIKTKFAEALWSNPDITQRLLDRTPIGRLGNPEDIVGAALYLASDQSRYHTGDVLVLDGGNSTMGF
jgi:NAD(P)-dependent dehydrogenase (short-subunit alcohol dehydrogenase family)